MPQKFMLKQKCIARKAYQAQAPGEIGPSLRTPSQIRGAGVEVGEIHKKCSLMVPFMPISTIW